MIMTLRGNDVCICFSLFCLKFKNKTKKKTPKKQQQQNKTKQQKNMMRYTEV